jgi:hypothetical protein
MNNIEKYYYCLFELIPLSLHFVNKHMKISFDLNPHPKKRVKKALKHLRFSFKFNNRRHFLDHPQQNFLQRNLVIF